MRDNPPNALVAALAGRYRVEALLGRGGASAVFRATDVARARPVALKVLDLVSGMAIAPERFAREIEFTARLQHPHICPLYDSGAEFTPDGIPLFWFTMPCFEQGSVADLLAREGALEISRAIAITREAASGLAVAHDHGLIHRDIKPANILLTADGHALVADFGIARAMATSTAETDPQPLTATGLSVGTPAYMSPEQATADRRLDARTDVYSLGAVLYEMLSGEPPYTGPTIQAIVARQLSESPRSIATIRPGVSAAIERVAMTALQRAPADRFPSMRAMAAALEEAQAATAPGHAASSRHERGRRGPRLRMALAAVAGAAVLALAVSLARLGAMHPSPGAAAGPPMIAVLPFENAGAPADAYFADGMADAIRGKLAELGELRVIGRVSSEGYRATRKSPQQVARELGARYLLTGTVRWTRTAGGEDEVEVRPELVAVDGNAPPVVRYDEAVDASLTDVFRVQAGIAARVARSVDVVLGRASINRLAERVTSNVPAYLAYLRGEAATSRSFDPAAQHEAISAYRRALALDSGFAQAWARLGRTYAILYFTGWQSSATGDSARRASEHAVALAPNNAAAAEALGRYYGLVQRDPTRALVEIERARMLAPGDGDVIMFAGLMEWFRGDFRSAERDMEAARRLDPRSSRTLHNLGLLYLWLRRTADARTVAATGRAVYPDSPEFPLLEAKIALSQGRVAQAAAALGSADSLDDHRLVFYVRNSPGIAWLLSAAELRSVLHADIHTFDGDTALQAFVRARVHGLLGDTAAMRRSAGIAVRILLSNSAMRADRDPNRMMLLSHALSLAGRGSDAIALGRRVQTRLAAAPDVFELRQADKELAEICVESGRSDQALDLLIPLSTTEPFSRTPAWLRVDPAFASLRENPRFERLVGGVR